MNCTLRTFGRDTLWIWQIEDTETGQLVAESPTYESKQELDRSVDKLIAEGIQVVKIESKTGFSVLKGD